MELIGGIIIGVILALAALNIIARIYLDIKEKQLDDAIKDGLAKLKETIIPSKIENVNGRLFLYNCETNEFLAQGNNLQELNDAARSRFPNKLFNVPAEQLKGLK